ncbi:MAG: pseudouridine synthase [Bacteroidetes bacterium]|nr:pseudouridine synthase [Bacteroidota bacterium]
MKAHQYFVIHKPFNVLSQFTSQEEGKKTLKDFFEVPIDVYPVGRLDYDSEGLLILTNDKKLNHHLLDPSFMHEREYWAQVEGTINKTAIAKLEDGVEISIEGKKFKTRPCGAAIFQNEPTVSERNPPIRYRKNIPTSWAKLVLMEGKNRQARKMLANVGFPVLRLIRFRIENITLEGLAPGEMRMMQENEMYRLLAIKGK